VFLRTYALHVEASNCACFNFFILQDGDLLLGVIEKSDTPIRASNRYEIFQSCDRVGHALGHLNVSVEPVRYLLKELHVHKFTLRLLAGEFWSFELWCLQLRGLLNHFLGHLLE
jgi:hypothetical protein